MTGIIGMVTGAGGLGLALLLGLAAGSAEARQGRSDAGPCGLDAAGPDTAATVGPGLDVTLASERRIRLLDVRVLPGGPIGLDAMAVLRTAVGGPVTVATGGDPDRWGRLGGTVALGTGPGAVDLAELLVGEGLAAVDPGERDALCRPELLRIEAGARGQGRGAWAGPARPLPADAPDAIRERAGAFALVEGRIVSVGERKERTYLNFGRDFTRDFVVVIPKRSWAAWKASTPAAAALRGRLVRVRGMIEVRRAPTIEVTATDTIELLDGEQARR